MQPGSTILFAHHDSDRLLAFHAAPATHQGNTAIDFPGLFLGAASLVVEFHMNRKFARIIRIRLVGSIHPVIVHIRFAAVRFLVVILEESRIHAHRHHGHIYRFADKVRIRHRFGSQVAFLVGSAAEHRRLTNRDGIPKFLGILRRLRTVTGATHLDVARSRRRIQRDRFVIETALRSGEGKLGSHALIGGRCRIRLFGSRLIEILPHTAIDDTPAHPDSHRRITH